jgi:hypothetical protein
VLIPARRFGVLALSANILDLGEQEVVLETQGDPTQPGSEPVGTILPREVTFAVSYARTLGSRLSAGATYKTVQARFDCTGPCPDLGGSSVVGALDLGARVEPLKGHPLAIGVAIRNLSAPFPGDDEALADALPTRLQAGARYRLALPERYAEETSVAIEADLIDEPSLRAPSARIGAELNYQNVAYARTGYVFDSPDGAGAAIGLGLSMRRLTLDIARVFGGVSADAGQAPMYLSLRYSF